MMKLHLFKMFVGAFVGGLCMASWLAPLSAGAHESAAVTISRADCDRLVAHVPSPDVAYRPGMDAHGRPVAPADLDGGVRLDLPEDIVIEIEVDLFERFGIPADPASYQADALIGLVEYRDGRFTFNGQPLQDEDAAALAERCQRIARGAE